MYLGPTDFHKNKKIFFSKDNFLDFIFQCKFLMFAKWACVNNATSLFNVGLNPPPKLPPPINVAIFLLTHYKSNYFCSADVNAERNIYPAGGTEP
jgi:hypothetical protein